MSEKQLATIQKIEQIDDIIMKNGKPADNIVRVIILSWEMVTQRSHAYLPGDLVVFFELDSLLPDHPVFEFMRDRKFRVKTAKFQQQISQGLIMPLDILKQFNPNININKLKIGEDVTDVIGVKKYDAQASEEKEDQTPTIRNKLRKKVIIKWLFRYRWFRSIFNYLFQPAVIPFPSFIISKTDETNIQKIRGFKQQFNGFKFYATEKLEGTSTTQGWINGTFHVCSRQNTYLRDNNNWWWQVANSHDLKNALKKTPYIIQGEIVGPGVQKNYYQLKQLTLYVFRIFNIKEKRWLNLDERIQVCQHLDLNHVPVLRGLAFTVTDNTDINKLIEQSHGKSVINDQKIREGLVFRSYDDDVSFKIRDPKYLLKSDT